MNRILPEKIVIKCDPATFVALFFFGFFAIIGVLFCLTTPFLSN